MSLLGGLAPFQKSCLQVSKYTFGLKRKCQMLANRIQLTFIHQHQDKAHKSMQSWRSKAFKRFILKQLSSQKESREIPITSYLIWGVKGLRAFQWSCNSMSELTQMFGLFGAEIAPQHLCVHCTSDKCVLQASLNL